MGMLNNPLVWMLASIAAVIGLVIFLVKRQEAVRARFFDQLSGLGAAGSGQERLFSCSGHRVRTAYQAGSRNSPSRLSLIVEVSAPGSFLVERQGRVDSVLEGLGLEGKIATSDSRFDERFHVVSDETEFTSAYFSSAKKREAAAGVFDGGCARLELDEDGLKAIWTPFEIREDTSLDFISRALPHLAILAEELPQSVPMALPAGLGRKGFERLTLIGFAVLALAFFILPWVMTTKGFVPLDGDEVFWDSLRYSGSALAVFLLLAAAVLKGKSWFGSAMIKVVLLSVFFFPCVGYWLVVYLNGRLDSAQPTAHKAPVVSKSASHGRNSTTYRVFLPSWRPGHQEENLTVSRRAFQQAQPGQTVATVLTKPGYLSHEWIVSYRLDTLEVSAPPVERP